MSRSGIHWTFRQASRMACSVSADFCRYGIGPVLTALAVGSGYWQPGLPSSPRGWASALSSLNGERLLRRREKRFPAASYGCIPPRHCSGLAAEDGLFLRCEAQGKRRGRAWPFCGAGAMLGSALELVRFAIRNTKPSFASERAPD